MNYHFPKIRIQTQVSVAGPFPRLVRGFGFPKKAQKFPQFKKKSDAFKQLLKRSKTL